MIIVTSSLSKSIRFQKVFRPHENTRPLLLSFSGFKSVFEKPFQMDGAYLDYFV